MSNSVVQYKKQISYATKNYVLKHYKKHHQVINIFKNVIISVFSWPAQIFNLIKYTETCVKLPIKDESKIIFEGSWLLNTG